MASPLEKDFIKLELDTKAILELKRALFRYGLTAHQFFGYVIDQIAVGDSRLEELLSEAQNYKKQRILDGKIVKKIDPETLYSLIQDELTKGNLEDDKKDNSKD